MAADEPLLTDALRALLVEELDDVGHRLNFEQIGPTTIQVSAVRCEQHDWSTTLPAFCLLCGRNALDPKR